MAVILTGMILYEDAPSIPRENKTGSFEPKAKGKGGGNVGPGSWSFRHGEQKSAGGASWWLNQPTLGKGSPFKAIFCSGLFYHRWWLTFNPSENYARQIGFMFPKKG